MIERIKALIDKASVISFDIYDTLLFRACGRPDKVFEMVAEKNQIESVLFSKYRKEAEENARKESNNGEITLEDIYRENILSKHYNTESLMATERILEENIIYANKDMFEVFQYALKNKRVILVSDMYLDANTILKALSVAGIIGFSKLYLSSEIGKKKANGELFDYVLETEGINASKLLHIGDNYKSDFLIPQKKGITSYLYFQTKKYRSLGKPYLSNALIENKGNKEFNNSAYYNFGYKYFGPALYGYVSWIKKELDERGINKVFFLAREGQLIKKAFDIIKGSGVYAETYLYASRRSLAVPAIATISSVDAFIELRPIYKRVRVRDQFEKVGLSDQDFAKKPWFDKCKNKAFSDLSEAETNEIIEDLYIEAKKVAQEELELLQEYLAQEGFNGKCALVDLGWNGSMQRSIQEIMNYFHIDVDITGFFLAQRDEYYKNKDKITNYGYLFNYGEVSEKEKLLLNSGTNLLEILFTADHATTIKYQKVKDRVVPLFGEYEYQEIYPRISECQVGALNYIKDHSSLAYCEVQSEYKAYFNNMYKVLQNPDFNILNLFGDINYSDLNERDMYLARKTQLFPIKNLIKEFNYSGWKVGFLKRNLRTSWAFPIYSILRKKFN